MIDLIDITTFDFRTDSKNEDPDNPDNGSQKLRKCHKELWSKRRLPNGDDFSLSETTEKGEYLTLKTNAREIRMASDWIINTYLPTWGFSGEISAEMEKEVENFTKIARTIGGHIIFPKNPIDAPKGLQTINQERGKMNNGIEDRFDLTLECIRRYYKKEKSPLYDAIDRYDYYFALFNDFEGFCDFFLLHDLTLNNFTEIDYFLPPSRDFDPTPHPKTRGEYYTYMNKSIAFINKRNKRMKEILAAANSPLLPRHVPHKIQ